MGVKLILAGLTLAAFAAVGCESNEHHHDHASGGYYPPQEPVGYSRSGGYYDGGYYNGGYYDRNGQYHRYDNNARPAGARVGPDYDHDRDHDGHHDGNHDHDHDGDHDHDHDGDGH